MRTTAILWLGLLPVLCGIGLQGAPIFYSISGDMAGIPRQFNSISIAGAGTVSSPFNLGDGSAGFTGGLTYRASDNKFYAIYSGGDGSSTLSSFSLGGSGAVSSLFAVGNGFSGGLAFDGADGFFYALSQDFNGFSTLNRISLAGNVNPLFGLGLGFTGGLTFDSADGFFYALSQDANGFSALNRISLAGNVSALFGLGFGFTGGLTFNPADSFFYAISNDNLANSALNRISLAGSVTTLPVVLGQGYEASGLTVVNSVSIVPEPSTLSLIALGSMLIGLGIARRRRDGNAKIWRTHRCALTLPGASGKHRAP